MKIALNHWESTFFGRGIYRVSFDQVPLFSKEGLGEICQPKDTLILKTSSIFLKDRIVNFLEKNKSHFVISDCQISPNPSLLKRGTDRVQKKDCLFTAKIPTHDFATLHWLQQSGFQLVETEITFALEFAKFSQKQTACHCRVATTADLPALKALMGNAFPNSRFRPPYFTQAENQRFYEKWIENALNGEFDDLCLITELDGRLQGAISLRFGEDLAQIGLLAVAPEFQRKGIGKRLLNAAIVRAKAENCSHLRIATQLSNIAAISLYQSLGATISETNYWFYR